MSSLKNCPFCNGEADFVQRWGKDENTWFIFAQCSICGTQTKPQFVNDISEKSDEKVVEDMQAMTRRVLDFWNRRANE